MVQNWSRVRYDGEYGYMSRLGGEIYLFVGLDYNMILLGKDKIPNHRKAKKWLKKLHKYGWIDLIPAECDAPFGKEFENRLPFVKNSDIIELTGVC